MKKFETSASTPMHEAINSFTLSDLALIEVTSARVETPRPLPAAMAEVSRSFGMFSDLDKVSAIAENVGGDARRVAACARSGGTASPLMPARASCHLRRFVARFSEGCSRVIVNARTSQTTTAYRASLV